MNYEAEGTLIKIGEIEEFGDSGFKKREVVLEIVSGTDGQYVETVPFEMSGKCAHYADDVPIGTHVKIFFSLRGRHWQPTDGRASRYFGSLNAWKLQFDRANMPPPSQELPPFPREDDQSPQQNDDLIPSHRSAVDSIPF